MTARVSGPIAKRVVYKPGKNRVKKPRPDLFHRALSRARKLYEKAELDLAAAHEKIHSLNQVMPGLRAVINGLEYYAGDEPSFPVDYSSTSFELGAVPEIETQYIPGPEPARQPDSQPSKKPRKVKPGTPQLYTCAKCGGFTATADVPPRCSTPTCMSLDLVAKEVPGPRLPQPNGAGGGAFSPASELTPAGDDDPLPTVLPGREILP